MSSLKSAYEDVLSNLTQPGSPFEIGRKNYDGIESFAYLNAPETMAELLAPGRTFGNQEFLVYQDERYSFGEFFDQSDRLAHQLVTRFGICKGDRVAIAASTRLEWIVAQVAIWQAGGVVVTV